MSLLLAQIYAELIGAGIRGREKSSTAVPADPTLTAFAVGGVL